MNYGGFAGHLPRWGTDSLALLEEGGRAAGAIGKEDPVEVAIDQQHRDRRQHHRSDHQQHPGADCR